MRERSAREGKLRRRRTRQNKKKVTAVGAKKILDF